MLKSILRKVYRREVKGRTFNKSAFDDTDIEKYVEAMQKKGAIASSINYYKAGMRLAFGKKEKLDQEFSQNGETKKKPPIHLIWGEGDHVLSKEMILETKKSLGKNATLDFIPKCSHWVQNDAADKVNKLIVRYLA